MSFLYCDSFEWCANNDVSLMSQRWSGSGVTATIATGRTGSNGLQVSGGAGSNMARILSSGQESATLILGAAVNMKSSANTVSFVMRSDSNSTTHLTSLISALDGSIKIFRGTSSGTLLA